MYLKFLRFFILTTCTSILAYQSWDLWLEYRKYETIVSVNIEKLLKIDYPGLAICKTNPVIRMDPPLDGITTMPIQRGPWSRAKKRDPQGLNEMIKNGAFIMDCLDFFMNNNQTLTGEDLFDSGEDDIFTCTVKPEDKPCGHVTRTMGFNTECLVYFSSINLNESSSNETTKKSFQIFRNSKDNTMAVIKIKRNEKVSDERQIVVLVIPNNEIPSYSIQKLAIRQDQLEFGKEYDVTFSKRTVNRLGKPYKPLCDKYDSDIKSETHCTTICLQKAFYKIYNCTTAVSDRIYGNQLNKLKLCDFERLLTIDWGIFPRLITNCTPECLPHCNHEIYKYEIKDITDAAQLQTVAPDKDTIIINLLAKLTDHVTYAYQPKLSGSDLMSRFGGFLSLWLGFSIYSICCDVEDFVIMMIQRKETTVKM